MRNLTNMEQLPPTEPVSETTLQMKPIIYIVGVALVVLGAITGYMLSRKTTAVTVPESSVVSSSGGKAYGSNDTKTFADTASGVIEKDGVNNEGTHKLIREGGPSQTACLVSSVLDLDQFVGKKVKVWSKTMEAKKCAWLMDVGRIELQ